MDELFPCPFCGGEAELCVQYNRTTEKYYIIGKCKACSARSTGAPSKVRPDLDNLEGEGCREAVRLWNRRVIK